MRIDVFTIFPDLVDGFFSQGLLGKARSTGLLDLRAHDLRSLATDPHRSVDDAPFGGGAGMVLKPEPIIRAVRALRAEVPGLRTILLSPQGRIFTQDVARELAAETAVLLVCGRYQGVDERARDEVGEELSVGDYVLSGGEVGAMAVIEATARMIAGVVGSPESIDEETFSDTTGGGLEPPLYTRPADFEGREVPAVLRSGDHAAIAAWRRQQSDEQTRRLRPDLVRLRAVPGGNK